MRYAITIFRSQDIRRSDDQGARTIQGLICYSLNLLSVLSVGSDLGEDAHPCTPCLIHGPVLIEPMA